MSKLQERSSTLSLQQAFTKPLLNWFHTHGRQNLPWQNPRTPYRVWVSEIMLQQTQVKTVIPYFNRFMLRFPDLQSLAEASLDEVLHHWAGLGYYSRGRHLHQTAILFHRTYQDKIPSDPSLLNQFPGIGASTAAAISALAFNKPAAILDGNVKRVLSRYFRISGCPSAKCTVQQLSQKALECLSEQHPADYTQAIMDLGALCCTIKQPRCSICPLKTSCLANIFNEVNHYPSKKITKPLPVKNQQFLLLHTHDNLLYLEKRPAPGLWGGLWCLPSIDELTCPEQYVSTHFSFQTHTIKKLIDIKHTFTHFKLYLHAVSLLVETPPSPLAQFPGTWFTHQQIQNLGLPKPISTIIAFFLGNKS